MIKNMLSSTISWALCRNLHKVDSLLCYVSGFTFASHLQSGNSSVTKFSRMDYELINITVHQVNRNTIQCLLNVLDHKTSNSMWVKLGLAQAALNDKLDKESLTSAGRAPGRRSAGLQGCSVRCNWLHGWRWRLVGPSAETQRWNCWS